MRRCKMNLIRENNDMNTHYLSQGILPQQRIGYYGVCQVYIRLLSRYLQLVFSFEKNSETPEVWKVSNFFWQTLWGHFLGSCDRFLSLVYNTMDDKCGFCKLHWWRIDVSQILMKNQRFRKTYEEEWSLPMIWTCKFLSHDAQRFLSQSQPVLWNLLFVSELLVTLDITRRVKTQQKRISQVTTALVAFLINKQTSCCCYRVSFPMRHRAEAGKSSALKHTFVNSQITVGELSRGQARAALPCPRKN